MKKSYLIYILFVLLTAGLSSCSKEPKVITDTDMSLAISGGMSLEVKDNDTERDLVISCSSPAQEDITVNLKASVDETIAELSTKEIIIKKGTKTAAAKITFKIAAFPENSPEQIILVNISTSSRKALIETSSTEFSVKGFIPLTLKAEINNTQFNTFEAAADVTVTLTISKTFEQELAFALSVGEQSSENIKELLKELPQIKIAAKETVGTATISIARSTVGILELEIKSATEGLTMEDTKFNIIFISERVNP